MEALDILEKKIRLLVDSMKSLKEEVETLRLENSRLQEEADLLGSNILEGKRELDTEKEKAKVFVEGLIDSIDSLVEVETSDG